jgi:hypothetical protein
MLRFRSFFFLHLPHTATQPQPLIHSHAATATHPAVHPPPGSRDQPPRRDLEPQRAEPREGGGQGKGQVAAVEGVRGGGAGGGSSGSGWVGVVSFDAGNQGGSIGTG